ncbi:hypothetical protein ABLN87_21175 [Ruegeria sp. SCPT10]|uniref:hypothetical protein n=1 Tax=Ruegeria sp. SCP10 TaxID=3141377 RepID=UPI00333D2E37
MGDARALTPGEIDMLSTVYGDSLDYSAVGVRNGGTRDGSGFTPFNTINVGRNIYRDDFSQSNSLNLQGFFVHEAGHILQTQNGRTAFFNGIGPQIASVLGGRREVYDYNDKLNENVPFDEWNIEEQASFFEDLYKQQIATAAGTPLAFDPYHNRVIPSLETLQAVDTSVYIDQVAIQGSVLAPETSLRPVARPTDHCFVAQTPIQMWPTDPSVKPRDDGSYDEELVLSKVWEKPINEIRAGDLVVAYDERGRLAPKPVTRTMTNTAKHILDFWGTGVTPGHAYFCADGEFKGQHVPLLDILRTDGTIMNSDGTQIRASTGCEVGSIHDRLVHAVVGDKQPNGQIAIREQGQVRLGTRVILENGEQHCVLDILNANGAQITEDGYIRSGAGGAKVPLSWTFSEKLPKPEDYILRRSKVSLEEIYAAGEWEQIGPRLPAPDGSKASPQHRKATSSSAQKPLAAVDGMRQPTRTLNRKQRKAMEAKQRKAAKAGKRLVS